MEDNKEELADQNPEITEDNSGDLEEENQG